MNPIRPTLIHAVLVPGLAALGGALMVFSAFDDAPGGSLLGLLLVVSAVVVGYRAGGRTP